MDDGEKKLNNMYEVDLGMTLETRATQLGYQLVAGFKFIAIHFKILIYNH